MFAFLNSIWTTKVVSCTVVTSDALLGQKREATNLYIRFLAGASLLELAFDVLSR